MKERVLFVILPYYTNLYAGHEEKDRLCPTLPYGVLSVIRHIKEYAEVKIFDCCLHENYVELLDDVLKGFNPSIAGFNMMYDSSFLHLNSLVNQARAFKKDIKILLGGAATPYVFSEVLDRVPELDAVCFRDGERPMLDLFNTGTYNNAWATRTNKFPVKSILTNLDDVVDIDFSYIEIKDYQDDLILENFSPFVYPEQATQLYMMGSRGCNCSCTFCTNSKNPDKKIRHASIGAIVKHIEYLVGEYGINVLSLYDEQVLANKKWAKELFRSLGKFNLTVKLPSGVSTLYIDQEMADLMWGAGVDAVGLAVESGSKRVLKLMDKPVSLNQVRRSMTYLRKHNFFIRAFLVMGIPGETDEDRQMSVDFLSEIRPDVISPNIASPILGSRLRDECIEKGYIRTAELGMYDRMEPFITTEDFTAEYIKAQSLRANWKINFVNNYRMAVGDYETARRYFEYVAQRYPFEAFAWYFLNKANEKLGLPQDWSNFNRCLNEQPLWIGRLKEFGIDVGEIHE